MPFSAFILYMQDGERSFNWYSWFANICTSFFSTLDPFWLLKFIQFFNSDRTTAPTRRTFAAESRAHLHKDIPTNWNELKNNIWLSDPGAYPVIVVLTFAVGFCGSYMTVSLYTVTDWNLFRCTDSMIDRICWMKLWYHHKLIMSCHELTFYFYITS